MNTWETWVMEDVPVSPVICSFLLKQRWLHFCRQGNLRMVWAGRDLKDNLVLIPPSWAGTSSTRPGCSKPHPTRPWTFPEKYNPKMNYVACGCWHMYKIITRRSSPGELRVMARGAGFFCRTSVESLQWGLPSCVSCNEGLNMAEARGAVGRWLMRC